MEYPKLSCVTILSLFLVNLKGISTQLPQINGPILRNCYENNLAGYTQDGLYEVDPDGGGSIAKFWVYCDMTNGATTLIKHDQMTLTEVPNQQQALEVTLTYNHGASVEQMAALIDSSETCKQELQLDCKNVKIYDDDLALTYWYDRDGNSRGNWGAETNVVGCQCRVNGNCEGGQSRCNCDAETGVVQSDRGYITDPSLLPVTKLYIDEVDYPGEEASYRVSAVQCTGSAQTIYPSCAALKEADLLSVDGVYIVNPSGKDPIVVRCEASTGNTLVDHSKSGSNVVSQGASAPGSYVIDPTYDNSLTPEQLSLLVETSEQCWQWLSLECQNARVFDNTSNPLTWWVGNNGDAQLNWAAPEGVEGCGCSQDFEIDLTGRSVEQSSTAPGGDAQNAIDGNTAVCQETQDDGDLRWWAIELDREYCISHLKITNTVALNQRLTGAYVTVGDSKEYASNDRCYGPISSTEVQQSGGVVPVYCQAESCGRYVAIVLPDDVLSLCEVDIFAFQIFPHEEIDLEDLKATQSSVSTDGGFAGEPKLAIDGDNNPDYRVGKSCILTEARPGVAQWWAVEFEEYQCVSRVVIRNREDCCYNNLAGAVIRVGSDNAYGNNKECGVVSAKQSTSGAEVVVDCYKCVCGKYLSIQQSAGGYLTFCEVQAYEPIDHDERLSLVGLSVEQSTTSEGGAPERAIDGDDNPSYSDNSCTRTGTGCPPIGTDTVGICGGVFCGSDNDCGQYAPQTKCCPSACGSKLCTAPYGQVDEAWWALDFGENKCVNRVVITNRDRYYDRLNGAIIRVGDDNNYGRNPQCGIEIEDEQTTAGGKITVRCQPTRCGRYISIHQDDHEDKILSLCEVEVYTRIPDQAIGVCEENEARCNCDADSPTQRVDAGYVREQSALPIQEVRVGDVQGGGDSAVVDIGPLVCEGEEVPVLESCQELYLKGFEYSGMYEIDPDGDGGYEPFYVYCEMTDTNGGITHINHDNEDAAWVPEIADRPGEYIRYLEYNHLLDQIANLIDISVHCQQKVRLDCYNYQIWNGTTSYTWWMGRNLTRKENWGSPEGTQGCACSTTNTCASGQPRCSCDNNNAVWNYDEGYITDKDWLPVQRVRTGGAGINEKGRITVGPLKCWGVDECEHKLDDCHPLATCADTDAAYTCTCPMGYEGNGFDCTDIDECAQGVPNACAVGRSECTNTEGSYKCECSAGYTGDGKTCFDVQECTLGMANCDENAVCVNTDGTFICACKVGYLGNGVTCDDVNECQAGTDICHASGYCENTEGFYVCKCPNGYTGGGTAASPCIDINECDASTHNCDANAHCVNVQGTFGCQCNAGFEGDGSQCTDINECGENLDNCDKYATCTNTDGGFTCACFSSFRGDGRVCLDINECVENRDDCSDYADCINTDGGYGCQCWNGYTGDGRTCTPPTTEAPPVLSTEAIIGIAVGGAALLLLVLLICCCCMLCMTRTPAAPPPGPAPFGPPPPPPMYLDNKPRAPRVMYISSPDSPPPSRYDNRPLLSSGNYARPYAYGRGNFNTNNSTDEPTTTKQVFFNPSFKGRRDNKPE